MTNIFEEKVPSRLKLHELTSGPYVIRRKSIYKTANVEDGDAQYKFMVKNFQYIDILVCIDNSAWNGRLKTRYYQMTFTNSKIELLWQLQFPNSLLYDTTELRIRCTWKERIKDLWKN
jgi:hypothetical protein